LALSRFVSPHARVDGSERSDQLYRVDRMHTAAGFTLAAISSVSSTFASP
jgi:hypothetical protein